MSNYTIAVPWSGKDALSDSDPAKVISGSDFNTEFTTVQTAINSKADINGSATESFSATTASAGTNTTQVATTAFVKTAIDAIPSSYPVGSIFITVTNYADSAAVVAAIGGTTWIAFAAGKMLVGFDSGDTDFDTAEETGGSKTHTLTEDEMPSHHHDLMLGGASSGPRTHISVDTFNDGHSYSGSNGEATENAGSGDAHNNLPPYIVTYMWKRTA